jgi:hypothetical protein
VAVAVEEAVDVVVVDWIIDELQRLFYFEDCRQHGRLHRRDTNSGLVSETA